MKSWLKSVLPSAEDKRQTEQNIDLPLAVCAILLESAEIDEQISSTEQQIILDSLQQHFQLEPQAAQELLQNARLEREKQSDLWPFTRSLTKHLNPQQKEDILVMIWKVLFADNRLDPHERLLMRRMQTMLAVNHSVIIKTKSMAAPSSSG